MNIAERVHAIVKDSLYKDEELVGLPEGETPEGAVLAKGVMKKMGFHPERLESHKEEIRELLDMMPEAFHKDGGGGWSFLQLCMDKNGNQWGEHPTMDGLIILGVSVGMAKFLMPRDMWSSLPGGMPYVAFDTSEPTAAPTVAEETA